MNPLEIVAMLTQLVAVGEKVAAAVGIMARRYDSMEKAIRLAYDLPPPSELEEADWQKALQELEIKPKP